MSQPILRIAGLSHVVAGRAILDDVSFSVEEGEFFSVVGPNGAGKTTLLKAILRLLSGWTGKVLAGGRDAASLSRRQLARILSYVPQAEGRLFPFTVREFVAMGRYPHLSPFTVMTSEDERAVDDALTCTGTTRFAHRLVDTLSGGERQKVYIAGALSQGAQVLLLDEPTTFLDPRHQAEILALLKRLNTTRRITVFCVTHDINAAGLLSDTLLGLKEGRVVCSGPPAEIMTEETLARLFDKHFVLVPHPRTGDRVVVPDGAV